MYCTKCGTNNSETANFCRKCGGLLEAEDETQVAARFPNAGTAGGGYGGTSGNDVPETPKREDAELLKRVRDPTIIGADDEHIFSIGPTLMFVKIGYVLAALGALLLVAILSIFGVSVWLSIVLGLLLFLVPAFYHFKAKLVRYSLTGSQIEVESGLISRTTRNIPLRRIQDVTVTTSAAQRLLGFGDLVIDNASEEGGKVALKNINSPKEYADKLLRQMRLLDH